MLYLTAEHFLFLCFGFFSFLLHKVLAHIRVLLLWAFHLGWNVPLFHQDCTLFSICFLFCDRAVFFFVFKKQSFLSSDIYGGQEIGSPDCFVFCLENSYHLAIVLFFRMALFLSKVLFLFLGFFYLTAKPRSFFLFKTIYNLTKYIKYSPLIYSKICYTWLQSISIFFVLDFFFLFT